MRIVIVFALIATSIEGNGNIPAIRCSPTMWFICQIPKLGKVFDGKISLGDKATYGFATEAKIPLNDGSLSLHWQQKHFRRSELELTSYFSSVVMQGAKLLQSMGQRLQNHLKTAIEGLAKKIGDASSLNMLPDFAKSVDKTIEMFKTQARIAVSQLTHGLLILMENAVIKTFGSEPDLTDLRKDAAIVLRSTVQGVSDILGAAIDVVVEQVVMFGNAAKDYAATVIAALQLSEANQGFKMKLNATSLVDYSSSAMQQNAEALSRIEYDVGAIAAATVANGKDSVGVAIRMPKESDN